jgi:hypothetical protein
VRASGAGRGGGLGLGFERQTALMCNFSSFEPISNFLISWSLESSYAYTDQGILLLDDSCWAAYHATAGSGVTSALYRIIHAVSNVCNYSTATACSCTDNLPASVASCTAGCWWCVT